MTGNACPAPVEIEVDRRELGPNARVGCDEAHEVVGVGDVAQRLLEYEADAGDRIAHHTSAAASKQARS